MTFLGGVTPYMPVYLLDCIPVQGRFKKFFMGGGGFKMTSKGIHHWHWGCMGGTCACVYVCLKV